MSLSHTTLFSISIITLCIIYPGKSHLPLFSSLPRWMDQRLLPQSAKRNCDGCFKQIGAKLHYSVLYRTLLKGGYCGMYPYFYLAHRKHSKHILDRCWNEQGKITRCIYLVQFLSFHLQSEYSCLCRIFVIYDHLPSIFMLPFTLKIDWFEWQLYSHFAHYLTCL